MLVDFFFLRQLLSHFLLRAAQHEGLDETVKRLLRLLVVQQFYGLDEAAVEVFERAQQSGVDKLEEVPQFAKMVLHRRTGEHDAVITLQPHGNGARLCAAVLDDVRFVKADGLPLLLRYDVLHAQQQHICHHHHVAGLCLLDGSAAVALEIEHRDTQRRSKLLHLRAPVGCYGGRCYDQRRPFIGL